MYTHDRSVPQAVKEIIMSNELYIKAVKSGIANYTALANRIHHEVELITGSKVNVGTVVVAIKRFADILNKQAKDDLQIRNEKNTLFHLSGNVRGCDYYISPKDARMTLTGSIIDIDLDELENSGNINRILNELVQEALIDYNLVLTSEKIRIFTEDIFNSRKIISSLTTKYNGKITEGLSKITITLVNENILGIRQLLFYIFDILNNYKLTLNNVFFTSNEIILILDRTEAAKTYDLLQNKIFKI